MKRQNLKIIVRASRARALVVGVGAFVLSASMASGCSDDSAQPSAIDASTGVDARGAGDATGNDANDAAACGPREVTGFAPTWTPPVGFHQKKCSPSQLSKLAACSVQGADMASCTAFRNASENADCVRCASADQHKFAGCVALMTGDVSTTGCPAKFTALIQCTTFACAGCGDFGGSSSAALGMCAELAQPGVCKTYADGAKCTGPLVAPGGPASTCAKHDSAYFADLFCGDGADAGDAAMD